jgi:hypothetical protein
MGLVLSVTLAYSWAYKKQGRAENEPLFYGKELKAVELQLILYDFKVCVDILSKPYLASCEIWLPGIWRRLGRGRMDKTSTTGSGGRGFNLWGPRRRRVLLRAGGTDGGEEETGD